MGKQTPPPPAPPPGYGGQPYYAQQPPPQKRSGCGKALLIGLAVIGGLVVVVIIVTVAAIATSSSDDDNGDTATETTTDGAAAESGEDAAPGVEGEPDEVDDVAIDTCDNDPAVGWAVARGSIANDSSETSTYFLDINVLDSAGTVVGNGISSVANVPAGGNATWEAPSTVELPPGGSCVLASVDRMAA